MREIQYEIVKEIAVLSTGDSGYTKEINLISWNGKEPKYDIRSFSPNREKCGKRKSSKDWIATSKYNIGLHIQKENIQSVVCSFFLF